MPAAAAKATTGSTFTIKVVAAATNRHPTTGGRSLRRSKTMCRCPPALSPWIARVPIVVPTSALANAYAARTAAYVAKASTCSERVSTDTSSNEDSALTPCAIHVGRASRSRPIWLDAYRRR